MSSVLLSPHHDDETLFAAFTIMRERPKVIVVLGSHLQMLRGNRLDGDPITNEMRQWETQRAMATMFDGTQPEVEFWPFRDDAPDWDAIREEIVHATHGFDRVYAPAAYVDGGHDHHDRIGTLAANFARAPVTHYHTYVRGRERIEGREVAPEPWMVARKLRALVCYRSQIELWPHHFLAEQREFYA